MDITAISDLHGFMPELPGGDLLIVAGDLTARGRIQEYNIFATQWLAKEGAKYQKVIWIGGNHDGALEHGAVDIHVENGVYLCDSGTEFEGWTIWGSPYTPTFCNWYFMRDRGPAIKKHWDMIPSNTDILVTHGPPYGILDKNSDGEHCGCRDLLEAVQRVKPKLHIFGHIHEEYGIFQVADGTKYINASYVNEYYSPVNKPVRFFFEEAQSKE